MKDKESLLTIPNIISSYRILAFPFLLALIYFNHEDLFVIFLAISLFTDILDGYIARRFNMQTEIGARLDSIADTGTYIAVFIGIYIFKLEDFNGHYTILIIFGIMYFLINLVSFIKFKRAPSLHLYMFKSTGYVQGAFILFLFIFEFNVYFYYIALSWGILACVEEIIVLLYLKELKSNAKGIYWLLKEK